MSVSIFGRELAELQVAATRERAPGAPAAAVDACDTREVVNLCINNYLGLASDPSVRDAADTRADLERAIAAFATAGRELGILG